MAPKHANKSIADRAGESPARSLTAAQREKEDRRSHTLPAAPAGKNSAILFPSGVYGSDDFSILQAMPPPQGTSTTCLQSLDELLARDRRREEDGFPRKIRIGRMIKPGLSGKDKVVVVPTTVEEKFIHDTTDHPPEETPSSGGTGEGEPGEVIGEAPVRPAGNGAGTGPGQGDSGNHEVESSAYDLGRVLTEQFALPNLKNKGKKRSLTRYTYQLTDRHAGRGQLLDKKATLRKIVETNIHLGNIPDVTQIDPSAFLISPRDRIYRILSPEKDLESQAMIFFLRDYSGSMEGKATEVVVTQHVLIYSWLIYQYARQVESRFILHDTEAREVEDFYTYYNSSVAGGTQVASALHLVNDIVEKENLASDYNIYVFHGTDGDDWDTQGTQTIPELKTMLGYASRVGFTVVERAASAGDTEVGRYLKQSGLLESRADLLRMDTLPQDAAETRLIEGIRHLIAE